MKTIRMTQSIGLNIGIYCAFSLVVGSATSCSKKDETISSTPSSSSTAAVATKPKENTTAESKVEIPTIISPINSPIETQTALDISGSCDTDNKVTLDGDDFQTVSCVANSYKFTVKKATDGLYSFNISQTDSSGNISGFIRQQWKRNNSIPAVPKILIPSVINPYICANQFTLSGTCASGNTVELQGLTSKKVICTDSKFSIPVSQTVDKTYNFFLVQTTPAGRSSSAVAVNWMRLGSEFTANIDSAPPFKNTEDSAVFKFSSNYPGSTFECRLDSATTFSTCTSPKTYKGLSNASHTFEVRSKNMSSAAPSKSDTHTWTQENFKTIALYHFESTPSPGNMANSSLFTESPNNSLTNINTIPLSGQFGGGVLFAKDSVSSLVVNTNSLFNSMNSTMTAEAFVRLTHGYPPAGRRFVILSKMGQAVGSYGWEFGMTITTNNEYRLYFKRSTDGMNLTENLSPPIPMNIATIFRFSHVAVTWDLGKIQFFVDGTGYPLQTANSTLPIFKTTALFRVGSNNLDITHPFSGIAIDEVRLSRVVRTIIVPTAPYTAD